MEINMEARQQTGERIRAELWPSLPYEAWKDTRDTLHMWTQIVGKVRMELSPFLNHWWHVTLYVTPRGLTTSAIPYQRVTFQVTINTLPSEVLNPIRYDVDEVHTSYDPLYAHRFWRILEQTSTLMQHYRSPFVGKSSPVHFFWGALDLAVTLFSGRRVPERPGVPRFFREDTTYEEISCGFWPGDERFPAPAFFAYTSPAPPGLPTAAIRPEEAFYNHELGEFLLLYENVRSASSPEQALLAFFQSTYEAGATLGQWDREALERRVR